ncbi:MAG: choice-of-anchor J domain-containing protein [Duncaniella sp.]|nr:choice-of-anchor J domain-containing protein [Duncaniella sp.]
MTNRYSFIIGALLLPLAAAAAYTTPYYSEIGDTSTGKISEDWTIINVVAGSKTWEYDNTANNLTAVTGTQCGIKYEYDGNNDADDWAISPAITLEAGTEYIISYWVQETKPTEKVAVYLATAPDPDALKAGFQVGKHEADFGTSWTKVTKTFTPEVTADYYAGIHAYTPKGQWRINFRGISIKENKIYPAAPSGLTVTPGPDKALYASLSWTLPTVDDLGNPLAAPLTAAKVYRDGVLIATLDGDATSYTDTSLTSGGLYKYSVSVCLGDTEGLATEPTSLWIGPAVAQTLPYTEGFTNKEMFMNLWSMVDVDNDATEGASNTAPYYSTWCWKSNAMGNLYYATIYTPRNSSVGENDWLISAPMIFPGAGTYKVSFMATQNGGTGCNLTLFAGKGDTPEEMTIQIADPITKINKAALYPSSGQSFEYEFEVPDGGTYYIGFYSNMPKTGNTIRQVSVGEFKCELVELSGLRQPPYDSADDQSWTPVSEMSFSLLPGYYHLTADTDGEIYTETANVALDHAFADAFSVVKVSEEADATIATTTLFNSFAITPADHTPAAASECSYNLMNDGTVCVRFTCPELNASGTALYETGTARIYRGEEVAATLEDCQPGHTYETTVPGPAVMTLSDDPGLNYGVSFVNLSGEGARKSAVYDVSTDLSSIIAEDAAAVRLYTPAGVEVNPSTAPAGLYIRVCGDKVSKIIIRK